MTDKPDDVAQQPERLSLKRWSRRKLEAARGGDAAAPTPRRRRLRRGSAAAAGARGRRRAVADAAAPLPPVESLTFDSDFTAFMQAGGRRSDRSARR